MASFEMQGLFIVVCIAYLLLPTWKGRVSEFCKKNINSVYSLGTFNMVRIVEEDLIWRLATQNGNFASCLCVFAFLF